MHNLTLQILDGIYSIHRLPARSDIPDHIFESNFFSISKTDDDFSIVCPSSIQLQSDKTNSGWSCIKVIGPLDFSLTGVLAKISTILADSDISIFAISTYDTDYILIKSSKLALAKNALKISGYTIMD
ncbi:ACT domain-containing protein [candidate division KSB1 bacterium]|nr:ACT domain-containing protein [candidate division KSB1 bacterium]